MGPVLEMAAKNGCRTGRAVRNAGARPFRWRRIRSTARRVRYTIETYEGSLRHSQPCFCRSLCLCVLWLSLASIHCLLSLLVSRHSRSLVFGSRGPARPHVAPPPRERIHRAEPKSVHFPYARTRLSPAVRSVCVELAFDSFDDWTTTRIRVPCTDSARFGSRILQLPRLARANCCSPHLSPRGRISRQCTDVLTL